MTRLRPSALAASACAVALVLAGCSDDEKGNGDGDAEADAVVCGTGKVGPAEGPAAEGVRITGYEADYEIDGKGGGLHAEEKITVDYDDGEHHGIYRDFDADELTVSDVTGTVDGETLAQVSPGPDGTRLTIGDPDSTLEPGEHVFGITFSSGAVLEPATDVDQDWQFEATVIDPGWTLDIEDAEVRIALPEGSSGDVSCVVGAGAEAHIDGAGTSTLVLTADEVPAGSGVRVIAGVDVDPYE
jgi:hypothetical protein